MPHSFHLPIAMHGCVCTRLARCMVSHEIRCIMAQTPQARLEVRAAGRVLLRYAQESSWREDNRRVSNGDQVSRVKSSKRFLGLFESSSNKRGRRLGAG